MQLQPASTMKYDRKERGEVKGAGGSDRPAVEGNPIRSGFALIEVLIALGLAAIVLLGTAEMLIRAVQIGKSAAVRVALTEAACSQLERLKGLGREGQDFEPGRHETILQAGTRGEISLVWDVEAAGPGILKVACTAALGSGERSRARASVLISERLGF
jgi:prepilin-type N-terminal cleavage/methylation domain-containing protein